MDELEQVSELVGLQREVDGVDGLAAEGRVHHDGRERTADGVAGDAVDLGGRVDLVDAIGLDQGARGDLAGAGLFARGCGGEGEGAAGADAEHAGDDARIAHADADDVGVVVHALEEAHERDVVGKGLGGGDDLDEVRMEGRDALVDSFEVLGGVEVVVADDEATPVSRSFCSSAFFMASADSSSRSTRWKPAAAALERTSISAATLPENLPPLAVRRQVAMPVAAVLSCEEMFELGQGEQRLVEIVEAELEEGRLFDDGAGFFNHLGGRGADDGDTDFTDTGTKKLRGYAGHIRSHVCNRGILQSRAQGCKFLLKSKGLREIPDRGSDI